MSLVANLCSIAWKVAARRRCVVTVRNLMHALVTGRLLREYIKTRILHAPFSHYSRGISSLNITKSVRFGSYRRP